MLVMKLWLALSILVIAALPACSLVEAPTAALRPTLAPTPTFRIPVETPTLPPTIGPLTRPTSGSTAFVGQLPTPVGEPTATPQVEPTEIVTPTVPAGAERSFTLSGTGEATTQSFALTPGVIVARVTHTGVAPFSADLIDPNGQLLETLGETTGSYSGSALAKITVPGNYFVAVDADGPWRIDITLVGQETLARASNLPQTFTGRGRQVTAFFNAKAGPLRVAIKHNGKAAFGVTLLDWHGEEIAILANSTGPADSVLTPQLAANSVFVVVVVADGDWSIQMTQ